MAKSSKEKEILFSIQNIKQSQFSVNEALLTGDKNDIYVQFKATPAYNIENNLINLILKATYHTKDKTAEVATTIVENIFYVENIEKYLGEDKELYFPKQLWITIVSLSVSHTRALLTKSLAGTNLQGIIIPIMDPVKLAMQFFPKIFNEESVEL